jgi:predicted Zn-dependent peptidase
MENLSTTSLGIFLKVGARHEAKHLKGIAHFTEHLLFKGTKNFSYRDIKREIEGRGGTLNGFTSQEITCYYAHFLNKNLKITLDILMDMVLNPLFDPEQIERERSVILEEIKMYNDLPHHRALSLLDKIIWEGHPLGEDVIGLPSSVKSIKKKDLMKFKDTFYLPSCMIVCCTGNIDEQKLLRLLKKKIRYLVDRRVPLSWIPPSPLKGVKTAIEFKDLDQTHLGIGFKGTSYKSQLRFAVELIHVIMGANMSSRLFEEVREKRGLCYEISTEAKKYKDSGAFIIHSGLDKRNVKLAFRHILKQLKAAKEKPVSGKELERAKDYLLGQITMNLERPQGRLFYLADSYITQGRIYTFHDLEKKIKAVDREMILNLARRIFDFNNICISCVGNIDKNLLNRQLREVLGELD